MGCKHCGGDPPEVTWPKRHAVSLALIAAGSCAAMITSAAPLAFGFIYQNEALRIPNDAVVLSAMMFVIFGLAATIACFVAATENWSK